MTNLEIIQNEVEARQITEEVDTYPGWKRKGYKVKKGSKATFKTKIWKPVKKKSKNKSKEEKQENEKTKKPSKFYLVKAYYFTRSQVEKIED